ncbi:MAG: hypothetical protein Kow0069_07640 [Promethearchaeota archaeon]
MRRYPSIDFLRGTAIFLMLCLHVVMTSLDFGLVDQVFDLPLINLVALLVLPFLGGLAGFFLLVSAIGNQVSMQRFLEKGRPASALAVRQVLGGVLLLVFAVLTEALLGYHGTLGEAIRLHSDPWRIATWRGYHMETIHTIAWCVILNGLVQAFLSRGGRWKDRDGMVKKYAVLAALVVVATLPVWVAVEALVPGYPYATYGDLGLVASDHWAHDLRVQYPVVGVSTPWEWVYKFFLAPLAGHPEPIFPYLAVSFVGSIIGVRLSQPPETIDRKFPRKFMFAGLGMFLAGFAGTVGVLVGFLTTDVDAAIGLYRNLWDHRGFYPAAGPLGWLFQFLLLNGVAICMAMLVVRLVEFRGKAKRFGERSLFIRRYGFVAFSVYNYQFLYYVPHLVLTVALGMQPYAGLTWSGVGVVMVTSLLLFELALRLWQKARFAGGFEYSIATLANLLIPGRRVEGDEKPKWWKAGLLDVDGALLNAEWIDVVPPEGVDHANAEDSRLSWSLAKLGATCFVPLVGLAFAPVAYLAISMAKSSEGAEGANQFNARARKLALVELVVAAAWLVISLTFTASDLGLAL